MAEIDMAKIHKKTAESLYKKAFTREMENVITMEAQKEARREALKIVKSQEFKNQIGKAIKAPLVETLNKMAQSPGIKRLLRECVEEALDNMLQDVVEKHVKSMNFTLSSNAKPARARPKAKKKA